MKPFNLKCTNCGKLREGMIFDKHVGISLQPSIYAVTFEHRLNNEYCGVFKPDKCLELPTLPNKTISTILKDRKLIEDNRRSQYSLGNEKVLPSPVRNRRNFCKNFYVNPQDIGIPNHVQDCVRCGKSKDMPLFDINIGIWPQFAHFD